MTKLEEARARLEQIAGLNVNVNEPLAAYTRFAIGGPAALLAETACERTFLAALEVARASGLLYVFLGGGTNLIVSDAGFPGIVLRYTAGEIRCDGLCLTVQAGAVLQDLVEYTVEHGLKGLETLAGIPGWVGAAIYGNAGAYGHSISERIREVRVFDGQQVRTFSSEECRFRYRESVFKRHKDAMVFSATLAMLPGDAAELRKTADGILVERNRKFPPEMKCAGSIFKNLILARLPRHIQAQVPEKVVREGKVAAAWFLDQAGAKGMRRGAIQVADYHANLVYNTGGGTAADLCALIADLKDKVRDRFGLTLEEEVQYVGFGDAAQTALRQLEATLTILNAMVGAVSEAEASVKPTPSSFSVAEALAHMAHVETHCYSARVRKILNEDEPPIAPYDPKEHEAAGMYSGKTLAVALRDLEAARLKNLAVLRNLAPDQFARTGMHGTLGRFTLSEMVNEWAAHDLGHVRQVANILREIRHVPAMGPFAE